MTSFRIILLPNLALLLMLMSCSSEQDKTSYGTLDISEILAQSSDSTNNSSKLKQIVNQIATCPTIDGAFVGIAGYQSDQYRRFLWLKQFATDDELIQLTRNHSVNVRIYSFMALSERNSPVCKNILEERIADTTQFNSFSGCIQLPDHVNVFYLSCIRDKVSDKEYANYKNKLSNYFTKEKWEFIKRMNFFEQ